MTRFLKNTAAALVTLSLVAGTAAIPSVSEAYPQYRCKY